MTLEIIHEWIPPSATKTANFATTTQTTTTKKENDRPTIASSSSTLSKAMETAQTTHPLPSTVPEPSLPPKESSSSILVVIVALVVICLVVVGVAVAVVLVRAKTQSRSHRQAHTHANNANELHLRHEGKETTKNAYVSFGSPNYLPVSYHHYRNKLFHLLEEVNHSMILCRRQNPYTTKCRRTIMFPKQIVPM